MGALIDVAAVPAKCWADPVDTAQYGTAIGAWGDVILDLGIFQHRIGKGGIVLYSREAELAEFVRAQTFVTDVRHVVPGDEYIEVLQEISIYRKPTPDHRLTWLADRAGVSLSKLQRTHGDYEHAVRRNVYPWSGVVLPPHAWDWAAGVRSEIGEFVLLQPYSFQSCDFAAHWPRWQAAVTYLLNFTHHTYAMVGKGWQCDGYHERLRSLIDHAPDMMCIFALSHFARAVVTTCNSLAHYCVIANRNALVCCNKATSGNDSTFRRFLSVPNIELIDHGDDDIAFMSAVQRFIA